ncbi:hypothetical protein [Hymenobacter swuensis]|nr:hypothetical protein [Hymenobacter swuensis]
MTKSAYYLAIPQPCHEDWTHMTPTERGRFCQSCRKEVLDFTDMAPADILHVIRQAPGGSVCGRIPAHVLDESRRQAETAAAELYWPQLRNARRWLATLGLPLLAASPLLARALPPAPTAVAPAARSRPATLRLRVYDPATGQGVGFAQVQLWRADALLLTTQAEADGSAQLPLPASDSLRLVVQVPGYRVVDELLEESGLHSTLAVPVQRGAVQLPLVRKEVEAPQTHRAEWSGGISSVMVMQPSPAQRVAQAPKRLFWWLRQRLRKND